MQQADLWKSDEAFATSLLLLFIDAHATEALSWTPENIDIELQATFGVDVKVGNFGKLMAAIQLITSNGFYHSLDDFMSTCASFAGIPVSDRQLVMPDAAEIAWGIVEGGIISSTVEGQEPEEFTEEIKAYIAKSMQNEGIARPPEFTGVPAEYTEVDDDPEMFAAIWSKQSDLATELRSWVMAELNKLISQLQLLPLKNGNTNGLVRSLKAMAERGL
jgi:hypothetical protein